MGVAPCLVVSRGEPGGAREVTGRKQFTGRWGMKAWFRAACHMSDLCLKGLTPTALLRMNCGDQ